MAAERIEWLTDPVPGTRVRVHLHHPDAPRPDGLVEGFYEGVVTSEWTGEPAHFFTDATVNGTHQSCFGFDAPGEALTTDKSPTELVAAAEARAEAWPFKPGVRVRVNDLCGWEHRRGMRGAVVGSSQAYDSVDVRLDDEPGTFANGATAVFVAESLDVAEPSDAYDFKVSDPIPDASSSSGKRYECTLTGPRGSAAGEGDTSLAAITAATAEYEKEFLS